MRMKGASVSFLISFVLMANLQNTESKRYTLPQVREALKPVRDICIERVSVNPKLIDDANNGNFASDRKLQCYYKCLMLMTKVMKNDKIVEKAYQNIVDLMLVEELQDLAAGALKHCRPLLTKTMEGCQLAFEMVKCFHDYDSTVILIQIIIS